MFNNNRGNVIGTIVIGFNENEKAKLLYRGIRGGVYHIGTCRCPSRRVYLSQTRFNNDKRIHLERGCDYGDLLC